MPTQTQTDLEYAFYLSQLGVSGVGKSLADLRLAYYTSPPVGGGGGLPGPNTITTAMLQNNAVTAAILADGAVTNTKLGANAVDNSKVAAAAAITGDKILGTALSASGGTQDASAVGVSGNAADLQGTITAAQAAPLTMFGLRHNGTAYPANPSARTDLVYDYIDSAAAHVPASGRVSDVWDHV